MNIWPRIMVFGAAAGAIGGSLAYLSAAFWPNGQFGGVVIAVAVSSLASAAGAFLASGACAG